MITSTTKGSWKVSASANTSEPLKLRSPRSVCKDSADKRTYELPQEWQAAALCNLGPYSVLALLSDVKSHPDFRGQLLLSCARSRLWSFDGLGETAFLQFRSVLRRTGRVTCREAMHKDVKKVASFRLPNCRASARGAGVAERGDSRHMQCYGSGASGEAEQVEQKN
jgi:hypothetical protein